MTKVPRTQQQTEESRKKGKFKEIFSSDFMGIFIREKFKQTKIPKLVEFFS